MALQRPERPRADSIASDLALALGFAAHHGARGVRVVAARYRPPGALWGGREVICVPRRRLVVRAEDAEGVLVGAGIGRVAHVALALGVEEEDDREGAKDHEEDEHRDHVSHSHSLPRAATA